jgi:CelD/BcsL family acetyltransferase involved in cellulose biosynthesis
MPSAMAEPAIEVVTSRERFEELRDAWNQLARANLFLTWEWLDCWWEHFGAGAELRVNVMWKGSALSGGIALGQTNGHAWALANKETDLFEPVARTDGDLESLLGIVASGRWSRLTLPAVPVESGMADLLSEALRAEGWLVDRAFRETCPIIDTSGTLEEYRRRLSSNARRQLGKAQRRLEREGKVELTAVDPLGADAPLDQLLDECFQLEAAGWKGHAGSAVASDPGLVTFWKALLHRFHDAGTLRLSQLRLDGTLIAFCLDVLHGDRLYSLKTSYDERLGYFSPGHLLRMAMIEACFEQGVGAQELLGPMLRWKERYATEVRTTATVRAYRRRLVEIARYAGRRHALPRLRPAYRNSRQALNRLLGRRGAAPAQRET